jgi:hypothetical protein
MWDTQLYILEEVLGASKEREIHSTWADNRPIVRQLQMERKEYPLWYAELSVVGRRRDPNYPTGHIVKSFKIWTEWRDQQELLNAESFGFVNYRSVLEAQIPSGWRIKDEDILETRILQEKPNSDFLFTLDEPVTIGIMHDAWLQI